MMKLARCPGVCGRSLCIVEDVTTTGGQIIESYRELRSLGARTDNALCVIIRDESAILNLHAEGLALRYLYRMEDLRD